MEEVNINSWQEILDGISKTKSDYPEGKLYFRGQLDAQWPLNTTLERYLGRYQKSEMTVLDYHRLIRSSKPEIESFAKHQWDIPSDNEVEIALKRRNTWPPFGGWCFTGDDAVDLPLLEYMVYIRHYGFPSPLLDWTKSPYVALFFAFNKMRALETKSAALYIYVDTRQKSWDGGKPRIAILDERVRKNKKHYLQQSLYFICATQKSNAWYYASHEDVFKENKLSQDLLIRLVIPASLRREALQKLDEMNINARSLFGSLEGLMQTIAFREFDQSYRDRKS